MNSTEQKYTLLVADDEAMVRQFVRFVVDKQLPEVEIVAEAADGEEMQVKALKHRPHILLTDIRMPKKDGLQAARAVVESLPETQVVFLTAYEEFDYAKEALNLKAEEYLVKPIRPDNLTKVLQRCIAKIRQRNFYAEMLVTMNSLFTESRTYLKDHFCEELLQGRLNNKQRYDQLAALTGYEDIPDLVVVVELDDANVLDHDDLVLSATQIENILVEQEACGRRVLVYHRKPGVYICFLNTGTTSEQMAVSQARKWASIVRRIIVYKTGKSVTFGIGNFAPKLDALPESYRAANAAKSFRFIKGPGQVFSLLDMTYQESPNLLPLLSLQAELAEAVQLGNLKLVQKAVDKVIDELTALAETAPLKARQAFMETAQIALAAVRERALDKKQAAGCWAQYKERAQKAASLRQTSLALTSLATCLAKCVEKTQTDLSSEAVLKAIDFIQKNYQDDLTLGKVAGAVYLSPYYFSRLFKRTTGMNFTRYLTQVRIDAAKELLKKGGLTVKEVAINVGYADPRYFSSVFKKVVGVSPAAYGGLS